jgi:hypothetical protein
MTFQVTAKAGEHGWELHIEGIGSTRSEGVEDAADAVRDYLELDGHDSAAPIDITFEFRGSDSLATARTRGHRRAWRGGLRELLDGHIREYGEFADEELAAVRSILYERSAPIPPCGSHGTSAPRTGSG